ncbi:hypothetical protein EW146_g975 [Bondarzewia mesenterica]|uniref:Uncharacterized protein n=1 Tax=Bondarzewia mesenterica TaxID=1095465 RepID=A0A4S4M7I1_9AGAM|nr:hypothetical protein EW146_g975 [Bondarzewia mesenterica]
MHSDNIVQLVAPRPVRITSFSQFHSTANRSHSLRLTSAPVDTIERAKPADADIDDVHHALADKEQVSPRASPRSNFSSEALEEFLSILRPALFPPLSPTLHARRIPTFAFSHERSHSLSSKPLDRLENMPIRSPIFRDDTRTPFKQTSPHLRTPREEDEENDITNELSTFMTAGSGPLASPISRIHTRNPFQRHPSYETPKGTGGIFQADVIPPPQTPAPVILSPSMIPLPPPTPSEMDLF